jgi:hypothetical protein
LGETQRISGTMAWTEFSTSFAVTAKDGCKGQVLRLELPARVPAEQEISGEIWFDDLEITQNVAALSE